MNVKQAKMFYEKLNEIKPFYKEEDFTEIEETLQNLFTGGKRDRQLENRLYKLLNLFIEYDDEPLGKDIKSNIDVNKDMTDKKLDTGRLEEDSLMQAQIREHNYTVFRNIPPTVKNFKISLFNCLHSNSKNIIHKFR